MPGRKFVSGIRNGRFKFPSTIAGTILIPKVKRQVTAYRFFNAGDNGFEVEIVRPNGNVDVSYPVARNCSVDVKVLQTRAVRIKKNDIDEDVEGVYELLGNDGRSGRFKVSAAAAATTTKISGTGVRDRIYRLFNSGDKAFKLNNDASLSVPQYCSLDVFVSDSTELVVVSNAGEAVQGVYDLLIKDIELRSGRFKKDANLKIVDFSSANPGSWAYRVYNSGANPFSVAGNRVLANSSIDIEIDANDPTITIEKVDDLSFEGVYEFLGPWN